VIPLKDQTGESRALKKKKCNTFKGIRNIFNKIITENFPNLEKEMPIQLGTGSLQDTKQT
jgi:hypothetical protein